MSQRALLVIDVQNAIFELPVPLHESEGFLRNVTAAIVRARSQGMRVTFVQANGPQGSPFEKGNPAWELHPALECGPDELVIEKAHPDCFQGTNLDAYLEGEVIIAGFATQGCVDTTVRSAYAKGCRTTLLADAHTTTTNEVLSARQIVEHHNFILQRFARVVPTKDAL